MTLIDKDAFLECSGITDIYCYAVPTQLTWDDSFCDDFMGRRSEKATRCHVYDEGDWSSFEGVNVTFVGDLPVVLEKNGDNSDLVAYPPTKAKDVTLADRFFIMDGSWNTLCLPFSLSSLEGTPLEGFTVKELDTESDEYGHRTGMEGETLYLYFKDANGIEAGKPYLVKKTDMTEISATPIYSIISGTTGSTTQQSCDKLIDGRTDGYRWRTSISENDSAYCEFKADHFVYVTGYTLTTSNQNTIGDPMIWRLKAKLNEDDAWTVIDSRNAVVNSGDALPTARTAGKSYTVTNPATYRFFRFEVIQTGGNFMCLSELTLHATAVEFAIENPVFPAITIINSPAAKVTSADGKVTFAGSYKPIGGSSQLSLGTDNGLFHLADGKKMGALHAAFFTGEVNSAGDPVGDVNGDGSVDTSDAMLLVNKILTSTPGISDVTDLNSDDRVSISDVVTLVKKILNPDPSITVTTIVSNVDLFYDVSGFGAAR